MTTSSSTSSDEDDRPERDTAMLLGRPRYSAPLEPPRHESHDSELDEILIDIPTIQAGSILDVTNPGNPGLRIPDTPPPLPPNHPKLSDSGISSNSALDSELDTSDWHYPDVPVLEKRHNSVRVRFSDTITGMRQFTNDVPRGAVVLPPGQSKIKCADILGVQNIPPPPLPNRQESAKIPQQKSNKKRSFSTTRERSKDRNKSLLPRSLQNNEKTKNSGSLGNLTALSTSNLAAPTTIGKYNGNNKLWSKKNQKFPPRPSSQIGSSLDGMIHREIAKAIRDRHALFDP
ncbi:hypothetical protein X975_18348, partial [Stegodyphus mimosarum]